MSEEQNKMDNYYRLFIGIGAFITVFGAGIGIGVGKAWLTILLICVGVATITFSKKKFGNIKEADMKPDINIQKS